MIALPHGSRVGSLGVAIGGSRLEAEAMDAPHATRRYMAIVTHHADPALVEEAGEDRVRVHVYPVVRGKPATVTLGLVVPGVSRLVLRPGSQWVHATRTDDDSLVAPAEDAPIVDARTSLVAGVE